MLKLVCAAIIIFTATSIYITYPLIFHLGEYSTGLSDELLLAWIHSWVMQSLLSGQIFSLFEANIYFPYHNTLAYSDLFFTTSILSYPIVKIVGEPIVANNFIFIFSLLLLGIAVFSLSYYLTKDFLAAIFVGLLVIFSPAVLDKKVHLQILAIGFVPFAILFFIMFLKEQKTRYLVLSLLFFLLQTYNSFLPGYFIVFSYTIILIFYSLANKKKLLRLINKKNIAVCFITFCLMLPIIIPYYQVSKEFHYTRDIRESIHLGLQFEDLLFTSGDSRLSSFINSLPIHKTSQNNEYKSGYIGLVFTIVVIFSLWFYFIKYRKKDIYIKSFFSIALLGLVLSLGPALHWARQTVHEPFPIPLPYALFYYLVPGFQGFRNAARWEMLFILTIAIVAAYVLHKALKRTSVNKRIIIYVLLIAGAVAEFNFPMQYASRVPQKKDFPEVYRWLSTTPKDTKIIEMPIYTWNMQPYVFEENMREYYSTVHFRKMINGASGYSPEPWQEMVIHLLTTFPDKAAIKKLRDINIDYIILHKSEYDRLYKDKIIINKKHIMQGDEILEALEENRDVVFIKRFKDDYVIKIK